jgi:hypothetical protein
VPKLRTPEVTRDFRAAKENELPYSSLVCPGNHPQSSVRRSARNLRHSQFLDIRSSETTLAAAEPLCWVSRRLKISAWREIEQQIPAQE